MNGLIASAALALMSFRDIRKKQVSVLSATLRLAAGIALAQSGKEGAVFVAAGIIPGAVLTAFARLLRGGIGIGDGLALMGAGALLGWEAALGAAVTALVLCVAAGKLLRKRNRDTLPFLPFLFFGVVTVLLIR